MTPACGGSKGGKDTKPKTYYSTSYLYHHGILGQKGGKRNGPPYPLGASDHSAAEKKAGWQKSLDKSPDREYNKDSKSEKEPHEKRGLTDKQKRAIKIGAAVAITALAAYGTYRLAKSGKLDKLIDTGKDKIDGLLGKKSNKEFLSGSTDGIFGTASNKVGKSPNQIDQLMVQNINGGGFWRGEKERKINCTHCTTSYILNSVLGMNTKAKGFDGIDEKSGLVLAGRTGNIYHAIFDGIKQQHIDTRNTSNSDVLKDLPSNSTGILSLFDVTNGGHVTCFEKDKNGVVSIVDPQLGYVFVGREIERYLSTYKINTVYDCSSVSIRDGAENVIAHMIEK